MKSFTMYIFKNRFKPLVWLLFLLCCFELNSQSFSTVHSAFYNCDFYRTPQNQQSTQITPLDYPTITATDFISATLGTVLPLGDDATQDIPLGNFNFKFFCSNVTSLRVGMDGALLVNTPGGNVPSSNPSLITATNIIAVWMDSWKLGTGQVRYQYKGTTSSSIDPYRLVIQYTDISPYSTDPTIVTDALKATFRVVIYAENNTDVRYKSTIAFYYQDVEFKSEGTTTAIRNFAEENEYGKRGVIGAKGECSTGRLGDGVNATVKNVNDPPLITLVVNELIRAIIFKPNACAIPTPLSTVNVCEGTPAFAMPNNGTQALNGQWKNRNTPPILNGLTSLNDVNDLASTFNPSTPGVYQLRWDPGCPTYGFNVDIRVDDKLNILTPTAQLSGCGQTTFNVQAEYPSVLTAGIPQWAKVGTTTSPSFPLSAPNPNNITVGGVSGTVNLTLTNGTCVTNAQLKNEGGGTPIAPIPVNNCTGTVVLNGLPSGASGFQWSLPIGTLPRIVLAPNGATATVTGLLPTDNIVVSVLYQSGSTCVIQQFNVSGGGGQEATVGGSTNATQTVAQCDNGTFILTALKPTLPAVGTWAFVGLPPVGVTMSAPVPVAVGNQIQVLVTVSGVTAGSFMQVSWNVGIPNINGTLDCSDAVVVTLRNDAPIQADITGILSKCNDGTFDLTGEATPSVYTSSLWSKVSAANNITLPANLTQPNIHITGLPAGQSAIMQWTVTNGQCSSSSQVTIKNDMPINAGNDINVCETDITNLTVNLSATALTSFGTWSSTPVGALIFGTPTNSLTTTAQLSNISYLNQTIIARFTGPIGLNTPCPRFDEVNVKINSAVTASITPVASQCSGNGSVDGNATFSLTGNPPLSPATGMWSKVGAGNIVLPAILNQPNITVTGLPAGQTATMRWTVTNGACSSSTDVILKNLLPADVTLISDRCGVAPVNLDALITNLVGNGIWTALGSSTGNFSGSTHPVLNGTTNYSTYTPSAAEIACGSIDLQISVTNPCTAIPIVKTITIKLGTNILVPRDLVLGLDYNTNNCETTLTGQNLFNNTYKYYTIKVCRVGIVNNVPCMCNAGSYLPTNTINASFIGQTIGLEISDACGNKATTCVKVEDKKPPIITCPKDVAVYCNTLVALSKDVPHPSLTGDLGLDAFTPPLPAMDGSVKDCSPIVSQSYDDECSFITDCSMPYTEGSKPTVAQILNCLKGTNVNATLAQELRDRMLTAGGDKVKFIIRRWTVVDAHGNISAPCYQVICVRRLPFVILAPADKKYSCNGTITECDPDVPAAPASLASSTTGLPVIDVNGNGIIDGGDLLLNTEGALACQMTLSESDEELPVCKGSRKIVRTFRITDGCSGGIKIVTQTIEVLDLTPPVVRSEYLSYERVAKKYCYVNRFGVKTDKISYELVAKSEVLTNFTGKQILPCNYNNDGTKKVLWALGDANNCDRFFVKFRFVACDHFCTKDLVTITSNQSTITGRHLTAQDFVDANGVPNYVWEFSGFITADDALFDPTYTYGEGECLRQGANCQDITFTAKDICGNAFAKQTFRVYMIDNQKPLVNCITSHTASLGTNGTDRIAAATFNNGTTDNCSIAGYKVRRMDKKYFDPTTIDGIDCAQPALLDDCYRDYVEFTCDDVGQTIMVEMLACDDNCNTNSCMVEVKVQNKNQPLCVAPATETTSCVNIEQKIANPRAYFLGEAGAFYNCGYKIEEIAATGSVDNCGIGAITRTWVVKNCANNTEISRCLQTINVVGKSDFTVDFPDDLVVTCQGQIPTTKCLEDQMKDPNSWANGYDGAYKNDGCGVIVVSVNDETLMANANSLNCGVILRTICVYDWCKYQPNSIPTKGLALSGEVHGYGTVGKSLACSVFGATSRLPTSASRFRDADGLTGTGNSDGVICYVQTIKIEDNTPPTATATPDQTIGLDPKKCTVNYTRALSATDGCTASTSSGIGLRYNWFVYVKELNKDPNNYTLLASGETNQVSVNDLAVGTYFIKWFAKDLCNKSTGENSYTLTVRDNEGSSIVSIPKKIAALGGIAGSNNGMATVCVRDFWMSASDNCTNERTLRNNARLVRETPTNKVNPIYPINPNDTCVMVTCTDVNKLIPVQLWTRDVAGNANFVVDTISVQDNITPKVCTTGGGNVALAQGLIVTDKNVVIQNAKISASLKGNNVSFASGITTATGGFEINNLLTGQGYDFKAAKEDEIFSGVTTLDISLISRHLLDIDKLKTPYSIIAADVDGNRVVDGADMLHMRNFILRKTAALPAGAWKFIDKKYTFNNPNEPLNEDFPELVSVENIAQNFSLGFTAVKIGDVNNTYRPQTIIAPAPRSSNTLTFITDDRLLEAGKTYSIKLKASDFKASDYQFTLGITEGVASVKAVEVGDLPNMGSNNFAVFKNAITTSWNGIAKGSEIEALTFTFVANQNAKLSEVLTINSAITPMDATNTEGSPLKLQLAFGNSLAKEAGEFALYQNRPNPMSSTTAIGFNLPKESEATLTVYNIEGKAMKVVNSTFKAGYNEVVVEKETFQTAGIYYYRLETSEHSATKKMVVSF
jgi:Secretion system C-terminal sorting domain